MASKESVRLKVAGAQQQDVGKGIVRIGANEIRSLALERGDIIEIKGKRVTAATPVPAYQQDEGIGIVRMDGLIRGNAKVGIGEYVELKKGDWKEAKKVVLAPAKEGLRIAGSGEGLKPTLLYRPLVQGEISYQLRSSTGQDSLSLRTLIRTTSSVVSSSRPPSDSWKSV